MINYAYKDGQAYEVGLQPYEEELRRGLTKLFQANDRNGIWTDDLSIPELNDVATLEYCLEYYEEHEFKNESYVCPDMKKQIEEYLLINPLKKTFSYILTQREPSIGTYQTENFKGIEPTVFRNRNCYLLFYTEELTTDVIKKFELTPNYIQNGLKDHVFTFSGELITERPLLGEPNEIVSFVNGELYDRYSYYAWFLRTSQ